MESAPATSSTDLLSYRWVEISTICQQHLNSTDYKALHDVISYRMLYKQLENLQIDYDNKSSQNLVHELTPSLLNLDRFVRFVTPIIGQNGESDKICVVWGIIMLLFEASEDVGEMLLKVLEMFRDLSHDLATSPTYEFSQSAHDSIIPKLMASLVDFLSFWARTINYLRSHPRELLAKSSWQSVQDDYQASSQRIKKRSLQLKEELNTIQRQENATRAQEDFKKGVEDQANLISELEKLGIFSTASPSPRRTEIDVYEHCDNLPFPRNKHFYGRDDVLQILRRELDHNPEVLSFKSWSIWGMGGIGKTQVALAYAQERREKGVPAVFWINCETGLAISRSFTEIALRLDLEGAIPDDDSEQNQFLVVKWLRRTTGHWLLILDNVEEIALIRDFWALSDRGSVLLTSRHDVVSFGLSTGGCELSVFSKYDGSKLLLQVIGRDQYDKEEKDAAQKLSEILDGLALALNTMASQIKMRRMSIHAFVRFYERNSKRLQSVRHDELYYKHSLSSCWATAFEQLGTEAISILGILSLISPDDAPEALFTPADVSKLPIAISFCTEDSWEFGEASRELLNMSLTRLDPATESFSTHRLLQETFRDWMKEEKLIECFKAASALLLQGFPKHANGLSLRNEWSTCKKYVQHVLMLCARCKELSARILRPGDTTDFVKLATSCGWYLMESGASEECMELMNVAINVCENKESLEYAHLCNTAGCAEYERGHVKEAYPFMDESRRIREKLLPWNDPELADTYNNYANLVLQDFKPGALDEALKLYSRALDIDETQPLEVKSKVLHLKHQNLGLVFNLKGNYKKATYHIQLAAEYSRKTFGDNAHHVAVCDYYMGTISYNQGLWDAAKQYWGKALVVFREENATHPSTSGAQLKLACVALRQNRLEDAIDLLQKTRLICQLNEKRKGDKGDTARVLRRLAEAFELQGKLSEAAPMKATAEAIRRQLQGERYDELGDTEQSYDLLVYSSYW